MGWKFHYLHFYELNNILLYKRNTFSWTFQSITMGKTQQQDHKLPWGKQKAERPQANPYRKKEREQVEPGYNISKLAWRMYFLSEPQLLRSHNLSKWYQPHTVSQVFKYMSPWDMFHIQAIKLIIKVYFSPVPMIIYLK